MIRIVGLVVAILIGAPALALVVCMCLFGGSKTPTPQPSCPRKPRLRAVPRDNVPPRLPPPLPGTLVYTNPDEFWAAERARHVADINARHRKGRGR